MKNKAFLLIFFAFFTTFMKAQTTVLIADQAYGTVDSLAISALRNTGTGFWSAQLQARLVIGDTTWIQGDTSDYGPGVTAIRKGLGKLLPDTAYYLRYVAFDSGRINPAVSITKIGRTTPVPQNASVTIISPTIMALPKSGIIGDYSSVGYPSMMYGLNANTFQAMTDTVIVSGKGTDTVFIKNNPGESIPSGFLMIRPMISGKIPMQSPTTWPAFVAPNYTKATIASLTPSVIYQDSMKVTAYIALGTAGTASAQFGMYDSTGTISLFNWQSIPITTSGYVSVSKTGLSVFAPYVIKLKVTDVSGIDTAKVSVRTLQVPAPSIAIPISPTITTTSFIVSVLVKTNGLWPTSTIDRVFFTDNNGTDSVIVSITNTATVLFTRPGVPSTDYNCVASTRNLAKLTATTDPFIVRTKDLTKNNPTTYTEIWSLDASTIELRGIKKNMPYVGDIKAIINNVDDGLIDTVNILVQTSGVGPVPNFKVANCFGGKNYCVTLLTTSNDGSPVLGTMLCERTIDPTDPIMASIDLDQTSADVIMVRYRGHGGGNACNLTSRIYYNEGQVGSFDPILVGSGELNYPYPWSVPHDNSEYKVWSQLAKTNGDKPSPQTRYFWSSGFTGIGTVPENAKYQLVRAYNLLGQEIAIWGEYARVKDDLQGIKEIVIMIPVDEQGTPLPQIKPRKVFIG